MVRKIGIKHNITIPLIILGPFECQDGVTNNCSEDCIRNQINERVYKYKCGCDLGFRKNDIVGNCEGTYIPI